MKKLFVFVFILLNVIQCQGSVFHVGPNRLIKSIKIAIEKSKNGDTLIIENGLYQEGNIILKKSITIIGQNQTILDGESKYEILTISANNFNIIGVGFVNSGYSSLNDFASIKVINSSGFKIEGNKISKSYFGIHISNSSNFVISNNALTGFEKTEQTTGNAIHCWKSTNAQVFNNHVQHHRDGIYFEFVTNSHIFNNISERNIRYGLHFMFSQNNVYTKNVFKDNGAGVAVMYSHHVTMEDNSFILNWGPSAYGLLLKDITDSKLTRNSFDKNTVGIYMEGSNRIHIKNNEFNQNGWAIKIQANCDNNIVEENNFFTNSFDVSTNGSISLNEFKGNYWDKYEGYDLNRDSVGDIPYRPVSLFSMIIESNPITLVLFKSLVSYLIDKAEKGIPSLTPEGLKDSEPRINAWTI